jgi:hypothetical protein
VLSDDFPFLIPGPLGGFAGVPTPPRQLLDYVEKNCIMREKSLNPPNAPWKALEQFLATPPAAREPAIQTTELTLLRQQVLRALFSAADENQQLRIQMFLTPDYQGGRLLTDSDWKGFCQWFDQHNTYWNSNTRSYETR